MRQLCEQVVLLLLVTSGCPTIGLKKVPMIFGGIRALEKDVHKFPYQVIFHRIFNIMNITYCSGSIISKYHILTAAHCVRGESYTRIEVTAGTNHPTNLRGSGTGAQQIRIGAQIYIHPKYSISTHVNDIAIIRLKLPLDFSSHIHKISLPVASEEFNGTAWTSGWGKRTSWGDASKDLYYIKIPIIPFEKCRAVLSNVWRNQMICAGTRNHSVCKGDSGGPLICKRSVSSEQVLCGIVSRGECGWKGLPSVFTKVSSYISWIKETMEESDIDASFYSYASLDSEVFLDSDASLDNNATLDGYSNQNSAASQNNDSSRNGDAKQNIYVSQNSKPIQDFENDFDKRTPHRNNALVYCNSNQYGCTENSKCIPLTYKCNGHNDCTSGSDELGCPSPRSCPSYHFRCTENSKCIPTWYRCDKVNDCDDGSDEVDC